MSTLQPPRPNQQLHFTASELVAITGGNWVVAPAANWVCTYIAHNTGMVQHGDVFCAFKGERFDAHDFAADAANKGATAFIVERPLPNVSQAQLLVANTRQAFAAIATAHRAKFSSLKVCAITGSSGKTTVKEMLGHIFTALAPTLITRGNLNNDLGVPMMLLELTDAHQYAIFELGANHVGEIEYTVQLVKPQVAAVLNIGTAHVGEFGGRAGIAKAKSEIYAGLNTEHTAIVPTHSDFADYLLQRVGAAQVLSFGDASAAVYASDVTLFSERATFVLNTPQGSAQVQLPIAGLHNVDNALAAAACALALGASLVQIVNGLANMATVSGRLAFYPLQALMLIDDTYNANPHAVLAATDVLMAQPQASKVLVLGDIAELGAESAHEHAQLGLKLSDKSITALFTVGSDMAHLHQQYISQVPERTAQHFASQAALIDALAVYLQQLPHSAVLFKGSRSAGIENIFTAIHQQFKEKV
jgi:UDP-N-acetylmuramoyl-tripeptide--D-alanyl-D-alanine ligase